MKLNKGAITTNVSLSLKEKTTISNPIYLFEFISDSTGTSNTCICQDVSIEGAQRDRSNLFNITEGVNDRLNSKLILFNEGRYKYIVRQQTSTTNLDISLSGDIVERGIMVLLSAAESPYIEHEINVTYKVHEPA
jgi:hypothetical protein